MRLRLLVCLLALAAPVSGGVLAPRDAQASVMIAVSFDSLVKDADAVAIATARDARSVWEGGRIYTYTKLSIDKGVAGDIGSSEIWVRTMGGVVGNIGQLVDGEPVFSPNKPALLFLRRFDQSGNWEVSARAQGQYPIVVDAASHARRVIGSSSVGVLLPPKQASKDLPGPIAPQSTGSSVTNGVSKIRLAREVLHDRPLDQASKEIADAWKRLHPPPTAK